MKWDDDRPKAQPEGPDQRWAELRRCFSERFAQWAYDEGGRCRDCLLPEHFAALQRAET